MQPQNNTPLSQLPPVDLSQPLPQDGIAQAQSQQQPVGSAPAASFDVGQGAQYATQTSSLSAEDVDLIEKAWVEKAKAIVQSTHGDPYNQSKELGKVKAEYIKKRFNKDIRTSE